MTKVAVSVFALICIMIQTAAATLSEEDVSAKMNQAFEQKKNGKTAEALELFLAVGESAKQQRYESERQVYVCSQTMACMCYRELGMYKEGYLLGKNLLQGKLTDDEREDVGSVYALNGYFYASQFILRDADGRADYKYGREILTEILPYADSRLKSYAEPKIPLSWYLEGVQCELGQRYEEALPMYENALKGFSALGKESDEADALFGIASVKQALHKTDEAKHFYTRALASARRSGNEDKQMKTLKAMWSLGNANNDLRLARSATSAMDSLVEKSKDEKMRFAYYNQKGDEAKAMSQYKLAERWYLKSNELAEKERQDQYSGNRHSTYGKLKDLYLAMSQYDDAVTYGLKAVKEYQKGLSPEDDDDYYFPYAAMADVYRLKGDRENCFASIDSLFICENRIKEPRELCLMYMLRARCHFAFKEFADALDDYKRADEILAPKYPKTDNKRFMLLALTGGVEHKLGMYEESERHYRLYAECAKQLYGESGLDYIDALIMLANAEGFAKHLDEGCRDYADAAAMLRKQVRERIPMMSVEERESFWSPLSSLFTRMTPYAIEANRLQDEFTESCYDALVLSKAFLLESERSLLDVVKKHGTEADMRDYMQLTHLKNRIKTLEKDYAHYSDSILALSRQANQLSVRLSERCKSFGSAIGFVDVDYASVKRALKPTDVLLDFTDYVSETKGRKYAAYIVTKEDKYPLVKYLFTESQIDSLGITRPDMYYDKDYAPEILKLVWEPLQEKVAEGATVYYVPSQLLFQVSLESLPLADGSLLGSHYNFVRLSSARELTKAPTPALSASPHSAVLYGGLQYDIQPNEMAAAAKKYDLTTDWQMMRGEAVRGDSTFRELPGSRQETARIESVLKACKWHVSVRMGMEGTEESFVSMHGNAPQVLHVATHGFYYTPERAMAVDFLKGYSDAMMLSGIVLSGGNAAWTGQELPEGVLSGILTADGIASLDLTGTEMVVLSACQSGQGKATPEGLYGLQRAFKKAGAGTVVMSLWGVSDKVTTEFMTAFYEQLASKQCQWNKRKAFENAKSIIRSKHPDPFYWAAFVMLD